MLEIVQLISAVLLIIIILLQQSDTGAGVAFGGQSAPAHTKRGSEKSLLLITVFFSFVFLSSSFLNVYLVDKLPFLKNKLTPEPISEITEDISTGQADEETKTDQPAENESETSKKPITNPALDLKSKTTD